MRRIFVLAIVLVLGLSTSVFAQSGRNSNGFIRLGLNHVITGNVDSGVTDLFRPGVEMGPTLNHSTSMLLGLYSNRDFNDGDISMGVEIGNNYFKFGAGGMLNSFSSQGKFFPYGATTLNILENNLGSLYINLRTGLTEKHVDLNIGWQFNIE